MRAHNDRRPPGRYAIWWGYLPLVLVCVLTTAMVVVVPSRREAASVAAPRSNGTVPVGQAASGWGKTVSACPGQPKQVAGDGYSPPCFAFSGDNGGATSRGVTSDAITVSYRMTTDPHILSVLAQIGNVPFSASNGQMEKTAEGLVDYFNKHFQFYGRHIELKKFNGRGTVLTELTGGGQEAATNDAVNVTNQVKAFADVTGWSQPYSDALSRNGVVNIGAPYMSREWFAAHRPFAWSNYPDCTIASETSTEYYARRLHGKPAAYAGGDLANRTRKFGLITPSNKVYRQCADAGVRQLERMGQHMSLREEYLLDTAQLQSQAASLLAKLKANRITSVICGCDAILMLYLAEQARQQDYQPEWLLIGTGFIDMDIVGQAIAKQSGDEWTHAFGTSPSGSPVPWGQSIGYKAFKSVRPNEEPSTLVDLIYHQLYLVALGIQMAGPDLTPANFEAGMFAYPGGKGPYGRWKFNDEHYTGISDVRELWWDPTGISPFNQLPGTYADGGERWDLGHIPDGDPEVFRH
jgi:hypothetical protein